MDWSELFEPYRWDDSSAAEDMTMLTEQIARFVGRQRLTLELTPNRLVRQLLQYVWWRQRAGALDLSAPRHSRTMPTGWTATHERVWTDWIWHIFDQEDWRQYVIAPVFGTDVRSWEVKCDGWREEIFSFLPLWIARSMTRFEEIDPTPLPEPEPEDTDPRTAKIDPYLLEHRKRGRRIKGIRLFE